MACARCHGAGSIACTSCHGTGNNYGAITLGLDCRICKGLKEIQCPACLGKPTYSVKGDEEHDDFISRGSMLSRKPERENKKDGTTARLVLAIHYLLDAAKSDRNKEAETRLIKFLIDRDKTDIKEKLTEILERGNPLEKRSKKFKSRSPKTRKEDLESIKQFFIDLKLSMIVNSIDDEINSINEELNEDRVVT
jgi:hypothetical protein